MHSYLQRSLHQIEDPNRSRIFPHINNLYVNALVMNLLLAGMVVLVMLSVAQAHSPVIHKCTIWFNWLLLPSVSRYFFPFLYPAVSIEEQGVFSFYGLREAFSPLHVPQKDNDSVNARSLLFQLERNELHQNGHLSNLLRLIQYLSLASPLAADADNWRCQLSVQTVP